MEPEGLSIRAARREDVPDIVACMHDDPLSAPREELGPPLPQSYYDAFDALAAQPQATVAVAEEGGAVVGTLQLTVLTQLSYRGSRVGLVESVHVRTAARGRGVGGRMMAWAIDRARAAGCVRVQLTSRLARRDAHRFYERLGFVASHVGMKLSL